MLNQRQVAILFDSCTRAVGAVRRPALAVPTAVVLVAGVLTLNGGPGAAVPVDASFDALGETAVPAQRAPMFASLFTPRHALPRPALPWESAPAAAQDGNAKPEQAPLVQRPSLKLTPEQQKIAQFVAKKYRIAVGDVQHHVAYAYRAAKEFRLDPYLVLAVMSIESSFNPHARSPAGAQGLMQVLTRVHVDKFAPFGGASAAFDPMANISVGSRILKEYLVREGSVEGALKSYVGAALHDHDWGYGYKVLSERERIAAAAAGRPIPAQPLKPPEQVAGADADARAGIVREASPGDATAPVPAGGLLLDAAFEMPAASPVPAKGEPLVRLRSGSMAPAG